MSKKKKDCILQYRCTEEEKRYIDKKAKDYGVNRSECIRELIFRKNSNACSNAEFVVLAQEILNHIESYYSKNDKIIMRMVDKLWDLL
jgi:hypothetical protein